MIPFPVLIIPLFILMRQLGLVDTLAGLILPAAFTAWANFLMRQFIYPFLVRSRRRRAWMVPASGASTCKSSCR